MESQESIVVGTDGSETAERAVDRAGEIARALGARVHLVRAHSKDAVPLVEAGRQGERAEAQQNLDRAQERLAKLGVESEAHLATREAGRALVEIADEQSAQMIVVGNRRMAGATRVLGSVPNYVSHHAQRDVLIVSTQSRSPEEFGGRSIVAGTDGSSRATRAVKEAIRLSNALDGELHIVSSSESPDTAKSALAAASAEAADQGVNAITHVYHEIHRPRNPAPPDPADALLDVAKKNDAAIIVVGSKGMHTDERKWLGNVPDKISHKGTCSVLIVFTGDASGSDGGAMSVAVAGDEGLSEEAANT